MSSLSLANLVLVVHFVIVLFIAAGLPLIWLGAWRHWAWVRRWRWRVLHLVAIVLVAAEALLGIACPLTVWEDALRGHLSRSGFLERWVARMMFFDLPSWVFTLLYVVFAALVAATWVAVPADSRRLSTVLRMLWALPCSCVGLALGLVVVLAGGSARVIGSTLEFGRYADLFPADSVLRRLRFRAITFGHVIVGVSHTELARLRAHERVHVRQYEIWGPLFLIAYPASSLWAWINGRGAYRGNQFELQAFRESSPNENQDTAV